MGGARVSAALEKIALGLYEYDRAIAFDASDREPMPAWGAADAAVRATYFEHAERAANR